ncbi:MAG TPA: hypothetical protein PLH32_17920, partial [bacterium]|nr:hypothetical protein [bacterium]
MGLVLNHENLSDLQCQPQKYRGSGIALHGLRSHAAGQYPLATNAADQRRNNRRLKAVRLIDGLAG